MPNQNISVGNRTLLRASACWCADPDPVSADPGSQAETLQPDMPAANRVKYKVAGSFGLVNASMFEDLLDT